VKYEDLSESQKDFCAELTADFEDEFYINIDRALSSGALSEEDMKELSFIQAIFIITARSFNTRSPRVNSIVDNLRNFI